MTVLLVNWPQYFPTTQCNKQIYIEKNKQQRIIIKEDNNLPGNSKTGEKPRASREKIHYVKNCYNHTTLIFQATPNNTHTLKDLTHNFLHSKTREQEKKNKILNELMVFIHKLYMSHNA